MSRLLSLTLIMFSIAACIFLFKERTPMTIAAGKGLVIPKEWLKINEKPFTPKIDVRPADQTFLTFPEWFLVFSPEEQANYFKHHTATTFPYLSHTSQIWKSYKIVNDQIKDNFPVNTGYHFMIWVIGTSASIEYSVKSWYEIIAGRITDTNIPLTGEDKFNAIYTQDYVDFIKDRPWYEFDFKSRLKTLWSDVSITGSNQLRKFERRYVLTSELIIKYLYGKLIGLGTKQVYEEALPTTAVLLDNDSLQYLPRYDKFKEAIVELAKSGHAFKEIAGNNSAILLTVLTSATNNFNIDNSRVVFTQPVASDQSIKRIAIVTPVSTFNKLLLDIDREDIKIEHVFDY